MLRPRDGILTATMQKIRINCDFIMGISLTLRKATSSVGNVMVLNTETEERAFMEKERDTLWDQGRGLIISVPTAMILMNQNLSR